MKRARLIYWPRSHRRSPHALILAVTALASGLALNAQQNTATVLANVDEIALQRRTPLSVPQGPTVAAPEDFSKLSLSPGTLLTMDITGIPEMSGVSLRVDANGDVFVPTLGPVHVAGVTVMEAQSAVARALSDAQLLVTPAVQLNVVQYAASFVSVLGEVQNPGRFPIIGPRTLSDVIALAGGETVAAGREIEIQHEGAAGVIQHVKYTPHDSLENLQRTLVQPGDSIYVRRAGVVYVLGAVAKPGGYIMVNGGLLNIFQALSLAGGTTLDAAKNGMYIVRPHDEVFETIKVPFKRLAKEQQATLELRQNDVLYIPRSGLGVALLDGSAIFGAAISGTLYAVR